MLSDRRVLTLNFKDVLKILVELICIHVFTVLTNIANTQSHFVLHICNDYEMM